MADYTAAGALLHCVDGWTYLGRTLSAITAGLLESAVHMAYYAELHSAMSILGSNGILISNRNHFVFDASGHVHSVSKAGTHKATWDLLIEWASTATASDTIGNMLRVQGIPMTQWLSAKQTGNSLSGALKDLFSRWGLDLDIYQVDRDRRNHASYEPTNLQQRSPAGYANWAVETLDAVWQLLEPATPGSFPGLDAVLMTSTLDALHDAVHGKRAGSARRSQAYEAELRSMVNQVVSGPRAELVLSSFSPATRSPQPGIIQAALNPAIPSGPPTPHDVLGMVGRTIILLRIATGTVDELRVDAGLTTQDLADWATNIGAALGYWPGADRPDPLTDMWLDGSIAVDGLRRLASENSPLDIGFLRQDADALVTAVGVARTALWSLSA